MARRVGKVSLDVFMTQYRLELLACVQHKPEAYEFASLDVDDVCEYMQAMVVKRYPPMGTAMLRTVRHFGWRRKGFLANIELPPLAKREAKTKGWYHFQTWQEKSGEPVT